MAEKPIGLLLILNAFTEGMSGGDAWCIEVAKRIAGTSRVITSRLGREACEGRGLRADSYVVTSTEKRVRYLIATYTKRTIRAAAALRRIPSDVLLVSSDFFPDVIPALFATACTPDVKWVQMVYHVVPRDRRVSWAAQRICHWLICRKANAIIVDNHEVMDHLIGLGARPESVHICYPGTELPPPADLPATATALYLGRVHPAKGIDELLEIWRVVCDSIPHAQLVIAGHASHAVERHVTDKVKALKLRRNVHVTGYVLETERHQLLERANAFVTASVEEGFGISLLEAMSHSVPVVAWDLTAYEWTRGKGICRIPVGDRDAFAQAVIDLWTSEDRRQRLSSEAGETAAKLSWEVSATSVAAVMQSIGCRVGMQG